MKNYYLKRKFGLTLAVAGLCTFSVSGQTAGSPVNDSEGNTYQTVGIGNLLWTSSNLRVTQYNDETPITTGLDATNWNSTTSGAYAVYPFGDAGEANEAAVIVKYGLLYNAFVVNDAKGIAPAGWRVATDDDWKALEMAAGMSQADADVVSGAWRGATDGIGTILRGTSSDWTTVGTDDYNFKTVPAGYRSAAGAFGQINARAYFWSSTTSAKTSPSPINNWRRLIAHNQTGINRVDIGVNEGYSIRLVRISPLPVNLINYKAKKGLNFTTLSWETLTEQNNDYFVIERSTDGKNFKLLGKVQGKGTSSNRQTYSLTDYFPTNGANYYRLVQHDKDGRTTNYGVRAVDFDFANSTLISAYPNPLKGNTINLKLAGYKGKSIAITLVNIMGATVFQNTLALQEGVDDGSYAINLEKKPAVGQYVLKIQGEGLHKTLNLIIE